MGKGGDYVREQARIAALRGLQKLMMGTSNPANNSIFQIGQLNADQTRVTLPNGEEYNVRIKGKIAQSYGPCIKIDSTTVLMLGQEQPMIQIDGAAQFYIVSGDAGVPDNPAQISVVRSGDSSTSYALPVDSTVSIFTDFVNGDPDTPQHYGGAYYANLSPDRSQLTVVRLLSQFGGARIGNEAGTPLPKIQVYWALYKGLGFSSNSSQITYSSVVDGAYELPFNTTVANTAYLSQFLLPGYKFGCPGSRGLILSSYMEVEPLMAWDSDNNFSFDLIGVSLSAGSRESALISTCTAPEFVQSTATNLIYGRNMQNGGSLTIGPVAYCEPGQMEADGTGGHIQASGYYCLPVGNGDSTFLAFKDPATGAGANISFDLNTLHAGYCTPYGVEVSDVTTLIVPPKFIAAVDAKRYYLPDPLWTDLFPGTNGGLLKVTDNERFLALRLVDNGDSTVTPSLTSYSYSDGAVNKGRVLTGKKIPSTFISTALDWR